MSELVFELPTRPAIKSASTPCFDEVWLFRHCLLIQLSYLLPLSRTQADLRPRLLTLAQGKPIVIDSVTDPCAPEFVRNFLKKHSIDDIVTVLVNERDIGWPGFRWYPIWVLKAINQHLASCYQVPDSHWHHRTRNLSCLNRMPKHHRFYTYYKLAQKSWFKDVYFSFGGYDPLKNITHPKNIKEYFTEEENRWFDSQEATWPVKHDDQYQWPDSHGQHNPYTPAYRDCYANLATETEVDTFCVTEKTTKNLHTGLIFFVVGAPDHMKKIHSWGFDLDYIGVDHSYDQIQDWRERINTVVNIVDKCYPQLPDIWHENLSKIQYNSQLFYSTEFAANLLTDVSDLICL